MKKLQLLILTSFVVSLLSCNSDDDSTPPLQQVESKSVSNLHAPQEGGQGEPVSGVFTKFDIDSGEITTSDTDWDIAFRGTIIIVNGGTTQGTTDEPARTGEAAAYIVSGTMESVTGVTTSSFVQDTASELAIPSGSNNGWYSYAGPPSHLITPLVGKILVFKTTEGKYAKMEILSYYKDAPAEPDAFTHESRYFTFNYVYQPNDNMTDF